MINSMEKIELIARFTLHPGTSEQFRSLMKTCIEQVRKNETGNLRYDWYHNEDGTVYKVVETYANAEAVMAHMQNVGQYLAQFMDITDFSGEVFGNLPKELVAAFAGMDVAFYTLEAGA